MNKSCSLIVLLFTYSNMHAVVIGSNTVVSRQANALFPRTDIDNEMLGFAAFEGGFSLGDGGTSCLYTALFPVSSTIDLRDGTLNVQRDLSFDQNTTFFSSGTINGNNLTIQLPIKKTPVTLVNSPTLDFITANARNAPIPSIDWSFDSAYIAVISTAPTLSTLSFNGTTLSQTSILTLGLSTSASSVRWHPTTDNIAVAQTTGGLLGFAIQVYTFSRILGTLVSLVGAELGVAIVNNPTATSVAWRPDGNFLAASLTTGTNLGVRVYSFGILGTLVFVSGDATNTTVQRNALDWKDNTYLAAGNSAGTNQLKVYTFNGTTLALSINTNIGQTVSALQWSTSGNNFLAVGLSGGTNRLAIYKHDSVGVTLTLQSASLIGETQTVLSVDWSPDGNFLTVGLGTSTETETRVYQVNQTTAALTLIAEVNADFNINSVRWSPNASWVATGDQGNYVSVYNPYAAFMTFNNAKITLNSDLNLTNAAGIIFNGSCEIDGNGYIIDLSSIQTFSIGNSATLRIKDTVIKGISGNKIANSNSASTLELQNVMWVQSGDYTLQAGKITVIDELTITGSNKFIYKTDQTSVISSNATMFFNYGMTFSYDPPVASKNLLSLADQTSVLYLLNTSLASTTTGLQLTKGILSIDAPCPIMSSARVAGQGIMFGDGVSSSNNLAIKILPESGLNINAGYLVYNNV